ncbi:hypothetical protein F9C07_2282836 [Aspergillus flavus]|uniref:Rhodopsin domain-containing protein n=1 Tax=Aspergillus flavus (strain ATCC 200026 / FGSC A1120 / IAM 13836 / NRRL 3357 / JCM 12722 / SRRC 167) TaxID=332952 RepID=A0A7U2QW41_ASPFN|nr:hypothetical protein AFLA_006322 [Aspergillus flavus NRRL3357]QRD86983.1 hypothetical protein F9C07_2282836 [Aspergillus flavus]
MVEIPSDVVAGWPAPNYADPETKGPALPTIVLLFYVLATSALSVRLYDKLKISRQFFAEDYLIILSIVPTTVVTIIVLLSKWKYLIDRHTWDLPPQYFRPAKILVTVDFVFFFLASTFVRLSFLAFYRRLVAHTKTRLYQCTIYVTMFVTAVLAVAYISALLFRCSPVKAAYDFNPPTFYPDYPYHCTNREMILFTGSLLSTILDFWIMLIPIPLAWQLDLPLKQRLGVLGMFLLGLLICTCGAIKTRYLYTLFSTYDEVWVSTPIWILSALELHIGILCSSAPTIRVVVREHKRCFQEWRYRRYATTGSLTILVSPETAGSYV